MALVLLSFMLTGPPVHGGRYKQPSCVNNLKMVGLCFRMWAMDNGGQFPFNVSTNAGGRPDRFAASRGEARQSSQSASAGR